MNEIFDFYIEDLKEQIITLNEALLKIEATGVNEKSINAIFRTAHTIKGNSASMGFNKIESVVHALEDILQEIKEDKREFDQEILKLAYDFHDFLEDCSENLSEEKNDSNIHIEYLKEKISKFNTLTIPEPKIISSNKIIIDTSNLEIFNLDLEILNILKENILLGKQLFKIQVYFSDCSMKLVRLWMIYSIIDEETSFISAFPPRPREEEFMNPKFDFDSEIVNILLLEDKDIDELVKKIESTLDVEKVKIIPIYSLCIEHEISKKSLSSTLVDNLNSIDYELLNIYKKEINNTAIDNVLRLFSEARLQLKNVEDEFINNIISKMNIFVIRNKNSNIIVLNSVIDCISDICMIISKISNQSNTNKKPKLENLLTTKIDELYSYEQNNEKIGDSLVEKGLISNSDVDEIIEIQKNQYPDLKFGQIAAKEKNISSREIRKTIQERNENTGVKVNKVNDIYIRVPVNKIDNLMDLHGELLILNSQINEYSKTHFKNDGNITNNLDRMGKIIKSIQTLSMSLRMVEIKPTLHRLTRIIRETSNALDKKINVYLEGEETEIDRSIAEKIFDPLMHLVRNSVSHGIESTDERISSGKKSEGQIRIKVHSSKGSVYIEVSDDGKGLDTKEILKKAKKLKLIDENREFTEDEITNFIFIPGLSTQTEINNISGRGVGMSVVESDINKIGGKITISNELGKGCAFTLKLPMNLAVLDGTVVSLAKQRFIVPTLFVNEFFIPTKQSLIAMQGQNHAVKIRDTIVPIIQVEELLDVKNNADKDNITSLIVLEVEKNLLALPIEKVLGRQEVILKPLHTTLGPTPLFIGGSILGDGEISLVFDIEGIFKSVGF